MPVNFKAFRLNYQTKKRASLNLFCHVLAMFQIQETRYSGQWTCPPKHLGLQGLAKLFLFTINKLLLNSNPSSTPLITLA